MKKLYSTLSFCVATMMAFALAIPAQAYNQVRLTFQRTGTSASDVTVNVTDENGNAIEGVSATLESLVQGNGTSASATTKSVALQTGNNMATYTNIVCAKYDNAQNDFAQFTFKITGLTDFKVNHTDLELSAVNATGIFQMKMDRTFNLKVWNTKSITDDNVLTTADVNLPNYGTVNAAGNDNTHLWEMKSSEAQAVNDYVVVRMTRTDANGCFVGISGVTLYNGYRVATTAVNNSGFAGRVATFSASSATTFGSDVTAYIASQTDDSSVTLLSTDKALPAKSGAILSTANEYAYAYVADEGAETETESNLLIGGGDETLNLSTISDANFYIFNKSSEGAAQFSPLTTSSTSDSDVTLGANKAALKVANASNSALQISFGGVTGIASASANSATSHNAVYDLSGRKVSAPTKGIYVKNGKKFIVK